jgi:hypothetical protein
MSIDRVLLADNDVLNRILYYASQHFAGFRDFDASDLGHH